MHNIYIYVNIHIYIYIDRYRHTLHPPPPIQSLKSSDPAFQAIHDVGAVDDGTAFLSEGYLKGVVWRL